jgi:hypothetical protein
MPKENRTLHGDGPLNGDAESYDFNEGSAIPASFMYWHVPRAGTFNTTGRGLQIVPSRNNLTGIPLSATSPELTGQQGLAFVGRRQTDTTFTFSVDLAFSPQAANQEAAVTVFSTQLNHIDVGLVLLSSNTSSKPQLSLRFRTIGTITAPTPNIIPVPGTWANGPIRLQIQNTNGTHYNLVAMPASNTTAQINLGTASAALVSGGSGSFVGSLFRVYATCNGEGAAGSLDCPAGGNAYFQRWRYSGSAQQISATESIPSIANPEFM